MVALWNRADHYIFILSFVLLSFFPRLMSAVAEWMSAIVARLSANLRSGLKGAARGSLEIQDAKRRQKSPSGHHRTNLSGYIFATKAHIDNRKKSFKRQLCPPHVFSPLAAETNPVVWGTPANFNGFRVLAALLHGI